MIQLLNESDKTFKFDLTDNPVTNPKQSPMPTQKRLSDLDPRDAQYEMEKSAILNHPHYSESTRVVVKPGLNKFENDEHAEWVYKTLGEAEDGGEVPIGSNRTVQVQNENFIHEVDKDGKPTKGPLFKKYRQQKGIQTRRGADPTQFDLRPEAKQ